MFLMTPITAQIEDAVLQNMVETKEEPKPSMQWESVTQNLSEQQIEQMADLIESSTEAPEVIAGGIPEPVQHKDAWFPINIELPGNQTAQQQQQALELQRRRQNMLIGGGVLLVLMVVLVIILKSK
jgi:tRNA uridine 5-carbamoylmethylation protein Kti12